MGCLGSLKSDLLNLLNNFPTHHGQGAESPCREILLSSRKHLWVGLRKKKVIKLKYLMRALNYTIKMKWNK